MASDPMRYLARELAHSALHLAILLLAAGRWDFGNAWLVIGLGVAVQLTNFFVLSRHNPGLLVARARIIQPETKSFDRAFVALFMALGLAISIAGGLDAGRLEWSRFPWWTQAVGIFLFLATSAFGLWAMAVNRSFSVTVVVRTDGSQPVCEAGPYRWVRHPGYLAAIVGSFGYSMVLGSWAAVGLTVLLGAVFVWRTSREDETLRRELPGYADYARRVPRRLMPGW